MVEDIVGGLLVCGVGVGRCEYVVVCVVVSYVFVSMVGIFV